MLDFLKVRFSRFGDFASQSDSVKEKEKEGEAFTRSPIQILTPTNSA